MTLLLRLLQSPLVKRNMTTHTLKGIPGLADLSFRSEIDVSKVVDISYRERMFCIRDVLYPYTLHIEYEEEEMVTRFFPMYIGGVMMAIPINSINDTQNITKRFKTEKECIDEIEEIKAKISAVSNSSSSNGSNGDDKDEDSNK